MNNSKKLPGSYLLYLVLSAFLWVAYVYLTFTAPINDKTNTFHLAYSQLMLIKLSVVAPYFIIWLVGIFAATGITRYILTIRGSQEEKGFQRIQQGVLVLLLGLIVGAVLGALRPFLLGENADATIILSVIVNYMNVFMPLVGFGFLFDGATHLYNIVNKKTSALSNILPILIVFVAGAFYAWIIFSNPNRQLGVGPNNTGALYLTDTMIILTLMVPYVIMWALGIFASFRLAKYRASVEGTIYRSALAWLTRGVLFTIILSIVFQGLKLLNDFFATANIQAILIAVYLILAAIAVGYIFLWLGARKLRAIENIV